MAELDKILQKYVHEDANTLGVVQGVTFIVKDKHGKTLYSNSAGKLNFSPNSPPFTADSVGWIASMSKLATSVALMQVVEAGKVGLDDDVGKICPELLDTEILQGFEEDGKPIMKKKTKPITVRHLLTHSSGLSYPNFDPDLMKFIAATGGPVQSGGTFTRPEYTVPLKFEPGDGWAYGVGVDWAGYLVEDLTSQTLGKYMDEHIFKPLGMASTTFHIAKRPDLAERKAEMGMRGMPDQPLVPGKDPLSEEQPQEGGGAGLYSTANDYVKLLSALLQNQGALLKPETWKEFISPQLPDAKYLMENAYGPAHQMMCPEFPLGLPVNYGLGGMVNLEDVPGKRKKGSIMWSGMSNPHWWIDSQTGVAGVLMTQVLPPGDGVVVELYDELERAVYGDLLK